MQRAPGARPPFPGVFPSHRAMCSDVGHQQKGKGPGKSFFPGAWPVGCARSWPWPKAHTDEAAGPGQPPDAGPRPAAPRCSQRGQAGPAVAVTSRRGVASPCRWGLPSAATEAEAVALPLRPPVRLPGPRPSPRPSPAVLARAGDVAATASRRRLGGSFPASNPFKVKVRKSAQEGRDWRLRTRRI